MFQLRARNAGTTNAGLHRLSTGTPRRSRVCLPELFYVFDRRFARGAGAGTITGKRLLRGGSGAHTTWRKPHFFAGDEDYSTSGPDGQRCCPVRDRVLVYGDKDVRERSSSWRSYHIEESSSFLFQRILTKVANKSFLEEWMFRCVHMEGQW